MERKITCLPDVQMKIYLDIYWKIEEIEIERKIASGKNSTYLEIACCMLRYTRLSYWIEIMSDLLFCLIAQSLNIDISTAILNESHFINI